MDSDAKIFGGFLLFLLIIFSYNPFVTEIDDLATNETTTNAVIQVLDTIFPYLYAILAVVTIALMLLEIYARLIG